MALVFAALASAGPDEDRQALVNYFQQRSPDINFESYIDGAYIYDEGARQQWLHQNQRPQKYLPKRSFHDRSPFGGSGSICATSGGV